MKSNKRNTIYEYYENGVYHLKMPIFTPYGRGRHMLTDDIYNLKNPPTLVDCNFKFISVDDLVSPASYQKVIPRLRPVNKNVSEDLDSNGLQGAIKIATAEDVTEYLEDENDDNKPAITYTWIAHITAPTRELLYKQKRIILDRWNGKDGYIQKRLDMSNNKKSSPIQWFEFDDSIGISGRLTNSLLGPTYNEDLGNFSTIENYGLLSYYPKSTLQDEFGTEFGVDLVNNGRYQEDGTPRRPKVVIDAYHRLESQAIIAQDRSMSPKSYCFKKGDKRGKAQSQSSCMAQAVANQFLYKEKRVIHLVLNDFDYFNLETKYGSESQDLIGIIKEGSEEIDVTRISINPFQPFEIEDGFEKINHTLAYESAISKVVALSSLTANFGITPTVKKRLRKAFETTLKNADINMVGTDKYWERRRYLNRGNDYYPTMDSYITMVGMQERIARKSGNKDTADGLESVGLGLSDVLGSRRMMLGNNTNFEIDRNKRQHYFYFEQLGKNAETLVNAEFVNLLDYCQYQLDAGDLLVIHGMENIDPRLYEEYVGKKFEEFRSKGIKLLYSFDVTDTLKKGSKSNLRKATFYDLKNNLYTDFSTEIDFVLQGIVSDISNFVSLVQSNVNELTQGLIESRRTEGRFIFFSDRTRDTALLGGRPFI